jgi:cell division septation protein DedD
MTNDKRPGDLSEDPSQQQKPGFDPNDTDRTPSGGRRREPVFSDFDEEEVYEEPDRDTDYASAYQEDEIDEDEYDDLELEDILAAPVTKWQQSATGREWNDPDSDEPIAIDQQSLDTEADDDEDNWQVLDTLETHSDRPDNIDEAEDDWDEEDEDDYPGEQDEFSDDHEDGAHNWPLGLIAVALLALLLLAAGGYGVIQQRWAMEEEILQLQASLATSASPADVAASREALQEMEQRYAQQSTVIDSLTRENNRLVDIVAGLESQLKAQQAATPQPATPQPATPQPATPKSAAAKVAPTKPAAAKAPTPAPKPATSTTAAPGSGGWFVNFGSYNQRAVADEWANRLKPGAGRVVVATAEKGTQTFYRVRVVGLANRDQAEKISRQLQDKYGLSKLWVGEQ